MKLIDSGTTFDTYALPNGTSFQWDRRMGPIPDDIVNAMTAASDPASNPNPDDAKDTVTA